LKILPIGQLLTNQISSSFYTPELTLLNGENRRSLAPFVLELFEKEFSPFTSGTDSNFFKIDSIKINDDRGKNMNVINFERQTIYSIKSPDDQIKYSKFAY
jgi:hypothetical protein